MSGSSLGLRCASVHLAALLEAKGQEAVVEQVLRQGILRRLRGLRDRGLRQLLDEHRALMLEGGCGEAWKNVWPQASEATLGIYIYRYLHKHIYICIYMHIIYIICNIKVSLGAPADLSSRDLHGASGGRRAVGEVSRNADR